MKTVSTGSTIFNERVIKTLRNRICILEDFFILSRTRILVFKDEWKIFVDRNTLMPVVIKSGTRCILHNFEGNKAKISVGMHLILVDKKTLFKNTNR